VTKTLTGVVILGFAEDSLLGGRSAALASVLLAHAALAAFATMLGAALHLSHPGTICREIP
jgi:hypothetical protein